PWAAAVCLLMATRSPHAQQAPAAESTVPVLTAAPAEANTQPAGGLPAPVLAAAVPQTPAAPGAYADESAQAEPAPGSRFTRAELEPLMARLETDGFARDLLERVFLDERLHRVDQVIAYNVMNPDSERLYEQFLEPFAIKLARHFHRRHEGSLAEIRARTGVSPEVIVGILLVETQFGTAALRYRLLEVFTTLIVDANPAAVDRQYRRLRAQVPDLDRAWMEERLAKKAAWAYEELKDFLSIRDRIGVASLYEVKGSYAGAFGMPQFMPSSYVQWAVDGDHDRRVDLDDASDAMASIANFLVQHGWRPHAPLEQKMRSVWEYNRSTHYVHTIFGIALALQRPSAKHGSALPDPEPATAQAPPSGQDAAAQALANPALPSPPGRIQTAVPAPALPREAPTAAPSVPPMETPQASGPLPLDSSEMPLM
ncbi:MAG: lytic murein transglycosylase, partial [SAR324 cluster bacterium]